MRLRNGGRRRSRHHHRWLCVCDVTCAALLLGSVKRESAAQIVPAVSPIPNQCESCSAHAARLQSVQQDVLQLVHYIRSYIAPAALPPSCIAVLAKYSPASSDYLVSQQFVSLSTPQSARTINKKQRLASDNDGRRSLSHGSAHSRSTGDGMGDDDEAGSNHGGGGGAGDQTDDESEDMRGGGSRRQSISSNLPNTPQSSSLYYQTTTADAQSASVAAAAHSSSNPFCKPCPLLSNLSKHPLRVSYVEIPREYTLSKKDAASQLSADERAQQVRVPIRIMGRPLDPNGDDAHTTSSPPALGRIPRSDIWVVSKDICAVLHIRKGNVAKTIAHFEAGSMKASMPVLCQRSNGTVSTHILTVLSIRGVHKLLSSSRSELAPSVSQWVHQQFEQLCGPEDPASLAARIQSPSLNAEQNGPSRKRKQSIPSPAVASQAPPSPSMFPALRLPTPIAVSRTAPMPGRQLFSASSFSQPTSPRLNRAVSDPFSQVVAESGMEGSRRLSTPGGHRLSGNGGGGAAAAAGGTPMQIQSPPQRTLLPPAGHHFPPMHPAAQFRLSTTNNNSSPAGATLSVPYSHPPHGHSMMQQQLQSMQSTPSSALSSSLNNSAQNSSFSSPASSPPTSPYKLGRIPGQTQQQQQQQQQPQQMQQPQQVQPPTQLYLQVPQQGQPPALLQSPCPLPTSLSHSPLPSSASSVNMQPQLQQLPQPVSDVSAHTHLFLMLQQQQLQQQQQQRLQQQHQLQAAQTLQQHQMLQQQQMQQQQMQQQQQRAFTQRQLASSPEFGLLADSSHQTLCDENEPM